MSYHQPVMAEEALAGLQIQPDGVYVDATFGGGGHARLILECLGDKGRLIGFDQDEDAQRNIPADERLTFVPHNFRYLKRFLRLHGIRQVDGILGDLGVSSFQLDEATRGFSFRFDSQLDMRMNQQEGKTAADVVNTYTAAALQDVLSKYGEVRNARTLAEALAAARQTRPLRTIADFLAVVDPLVRGQRNRYLAQVFQALRMEVNDEVGVLTEFLEQCAVTLRPGGRLVVITYHSIEDRITKNVMRTGNAAGEVEQDFFGHIFRPYTLVTKKAVLPTAAEIERNPRARSAKLRIAERTAEERKEEVPPATGA